MICSYTLRYYCYYIHVHVGMRVYWFFFYNTSSSTVKNALPNLKANARSRQKRSYSIFFFQDSTITGSDGPTGPNAAKFGSYYKYMNAAALSKRNEIMTLVSSKAFPGQCTACRGWGVSNVFVWFFPLLII